jgi:CRISPR-associated protein Cmr6
MTDFFHPSDTRQYVNPDKIDNFALKYSLFQNFEKEGKKYKIKHPQKVSMSKAGQEMIAILKKRQESQLKCLSTLYDFRVIEAEVDWRLIVGLGNEHVQETSMTLHHIYGIPYIPASAIKGVLHHLAEEKNDEEKKKVLRSIFGSEESNEQKAKKGKVIFMDAFPVSDVKFAVDIMNPHYPEYYNNETYPGDWQNPVPIKFMTVEKTKFCFIFLVMKKGPDYKENPDYLKQIFEWLKEIFESGGIGAKTAVGYGYFKNYDDITEKKTKAR